MIREARYTSTSIALADGWTQERLTPPSRLFGANGLRTGPDGRIYVAQVIGSQVSALDVATGALEIISPKGGDIIAPDDLAFHPNGSMFATEVMDARVSMRRPDGSARVLRDDIPLANGITVHEGRLFVGEFYMGGRLLELDPNGGAPRVLVEGLAMPNAMEVGPDGLLYYPVMGAGEIWRISPDGGEPELVAGDLLGPDALKFDSQGRIITTLAPTGEVVRIDPRTGERTVLANLDPGLDNLTFVDGRLFISGYTGEITEILDGGQTRTALPGGLNWPLDLTADPAGNLFVADGNYFYALSPRGELRQLGMMFTPGWPGNIRGAIAMGADEFIVTTTNGEISRWRSESQETEVLVEGYDQLYGIAAGPGGELVTAEFGTGRVLSLRSGKAEVLATGLNRPTGVVFGPDGTCLVSESGAGRVVSVTGAGMDTVVDGLDAPQGMLVHSGQLYIVDAGAKALIRIDLVSKARDTIARDLPVGVPDGVTPKPLNGLPPFSGPQGPFAGITAGPDGTLYVSGDAEGSVLALREEG